MKMRSIIPGANYGVLRLNAERLRHIRREQATFGGHFAEVARKLGYARSDEDRELSWLARQLDQGERVRSERSSALEARLRAARGRLGLSHEEMIAHACAEDDERD